MRPDQFWEDVVNIMVQCIFYSVLSAIVVFLIGWTYTVFLLLYYMAGKTIYFLLELSSELDEEVAKALQPVTDQEGMAILLWPLITIQLRLNEAKSRKPTAKHKEPVT